MIRSLFVAPDGWLALVWRLVAYLVLSLVVIAVGSTVGIDAGVALGEAFGVTPGEAPGPASTVIRNALVAVATVALSLGLTYLFRRFVDRRPWSGMALPALGGRVPDVLGGFLLGAVMLAAVFLVEWAVGWVSVVGFETSSSGLAAALIYIVAGLIGFAAVGFREEIAFRGYLFQNLGELLPIWAAALVFGVVFGAAHYGNDGFGLAFVVGALITTIFLVLTRLLTGSLWFAIGWHSAWDFMQVSVLGIAVAEDENYGHALVHLEQRGPALWVGEGSSIEGSLVAIGVIALAAVVSAVLFTRRAGPEGWSARLDEEGSLAGAGARDRSTG